MEDSKIISLFFERSQQGINEVSDKYGGLCLRIAENILKNPEDAKECVNDAYLALWNTIPPENPNPLKTYLIKIVRNSAIKKYHTNTAKKRNSYYDSALSELEEVLADAHSVENEIVAKEIGLAVNMFLNGISKENRIFFLRRYYYGDSVSEIARLTGHTAHFVSVRLSRTRENLRKYLRKEGLL